MRHIPEDELHAYLDQALSRSQCVEIESHLAHCPACRQDRDGIAALRDRTTAVLAQLAPPLRRPPSWSSLEAEARRRAATRRHRAVRLGWAASLAAAVGLGWVARDLSPDAMATGLPEAPPIVVPSPDRSPPSVPVTAAAPAANDRAGEGRVPAPAADRTPDTIRLDAMLAEPGPGVPAPSGTSVRSVDRLRESGDLALDGIWRTLSWDRLQRDTTTWVPHVDGLPVTEVQASRTGASGITVVAQQLSSGETIRTVAGPTAEVSSLLSRGQVQSSSAPLESVPAGNGSPGAMAFNAGGDRMLAVFGPVSPDSLRAYLLRVK